MLVLASKLLHSGMNAAQKLLRTALGEHNRGSCLWRSGLRVYCPGGLKAFESSLGQEISLLKKFYGKIFAQ
jgi:hypothetical protein